MRPITRLRNSFLAGLLLLLPLAVTVFVLQFVFNRVTPVIRPLVVRIEPQLRMSLGYDGELLFVAQVLSALVIVLVIVVVGDLASRDFGRRLFGSFERGVELVPVVRTVYFGVRQVAESLTERNSRYESVVLVEFPREGLYSIGFVTNESPRQVRQVADDDAVNVFVPNSPNPTAGALVMLPADDVYEVDMSVRRGIRLLVTTGLSVDDIDEAELPERVAGRSPSADGGRTESDGGAGR
jgi:uncharacterized membrane protein